jgi:hypothetical protein
MWNPFAVTIGEKISHLSIKAKESLMELSWDTSLKIKFEALSLLEFWIYIKKEHLELSQLPTEVLLLFGMTYLCEKTFSAMAAIKSEYRNHLQLESNLQDAVSTIQPRMSHPVSNMQAHPFHWVSTVSHFYTLSVSMVSTGKDSMISLGGHGENRGSNLMENKYMYIFTYNNTKKWPLYVCLWWLM